MHSQNSFWTIKGPSINNVDNWDGRGVKIDDGYFSVPNKHVGQNKRTSGKILEKTLNVRTKIRPGRVEFFIILNKRAGKYQYTCSMQ